MARALIKSKGDILGGFILRAVTATLLLYRVVEYESVAAARCDRESLRAAFRIEGKLGVVVVSIRKLREASRSLCVDVVKVGQHRYMARRAAQRIVTEAIEMVALEASRPIAHHLPWLRMTYVCASRVGGAPRRGAVAAREEDPGETHQAADDVDEPVPADRRIRVARGKGARARDAEDDEVVDALDAERVLLFVASCQ